MKSIFNTAALALLLLASLSGCNRRAAFWLLMAPPVGTDNQVDTKAPLSSWTPASHPLASSEECEQLKAKLVLYEANRSGKQELQDTFKNFGPAQLAIAQMSIADAVCASSDDPRLRPN